MRCPFCGHEETQVKDSRPTEDNSAIRRRRACPECEQRFTTFERIQMREITVLKTGGRKQPFNVDKVIKSMQIALRKRPVELTQIEVAANKIMRKIEVEGESEIEARKVGEHVMAALIDLDVVGYIRYASVYEDFGAPDDFKNFLENVKKRQADAS